MDVWVNFKNATKWQAEGIFKNFFPCKPAASSLPATPSSNTTTPASPESSPTEEELGVPKQRTHLIPTLEEAELSQLAKQFADEIPEDELSVCSNNNIRSHHLLTLRVRLLLFKATY
jgi:chaperone BCS1